MGTYQIKDPNSGAILIKKDKEGQDLDRALEVIEILSKKVEELEAKLDKKSK